MIAPIHPDVIRRLAPKFQRPTPPREPSTSPDPLKDAGLDEVERAYVATVMSVMTSPAFKHVRDRVRSGEIALAIEGDEVTWVDADQVRDEIAREARIDLASDAQDSIRRLIQEASAAGTVLTHIASRLEQTVQPSGHTASADAVIGVVCAEWGVKPAEIPSKRRAGSVAEARHVAIVLLGRLGVADSRISELVDRDQSTLCFARRAVRRRLSSDSKFATKFTRASALIVGTPSVSPTQQENT